MIFASHFPLFIVLALTGILDLAIALFVVRGNRSATNLTFAFWSFLVGLWSIFVSIMNIGINPALIPFGFKSAAFSGSFIPPFFLLLSLVFPDKSLLLKKRSLFFLMVPAIFFGVVSPTNYWLSINYISQADVSIVVGTLWSLLYLSYYLIYLSAGTILLIMKYIKAQGRRKQQFIYMFVGLFISFLFGIFCTILPVLLGVGKYLYFGPLGTIFFIVLTAYAITKTELMDIRVAISKTAAYGFVGALVVASFVLLNLQPMPIALIVSVNAAFGLFWAFIAHRLREFIQTPLEEKWITGWYNSDKLINGIAQRLVPAIEKKKVFDIISEELKNVIKIKDIHIFIGKPETEYAEITQTKNGLVIPLSSSDGVEGILTLNQKTSEDSYNERDLTLFRTIIIQAMAIFDRIRPYEKIRAEFEANQKKLVEAQMQLERAQRLSSLGRIISEVAHEIRNPMAVIYSKANRIKSNLSDQNYILTATNLILERCEHIDSVVSTMRALSLPPKYEPVELDIRDPIETSLRFMPAKLNIKIKKEFNDVPHIMGDKNELERVFINLFTNAYDAMSEKGGELTVRLQGEGDHVKVETEDTGCGITKDDLPKIFEPFFSTKFGQINDRMGFGLSIVHDIIVEKHKGTIAAESEQGKGCKFIITFPAKIG